MVSITIFLLFVVDTFGRKKSFVASGLVMFFFMFYIGFCKALRVRNLVTPALIFAADSRFDPPVKVINSARTVVGGADKFQGKPVGGAGYFALVSVVSVHELVSRKYVLTNS